MNRLFRKTVIVLILLFCSLLSIDLRAQTTETDSLVFYWQKAFFAEVQKEPAEIIRCYDRVRDLCESLPLDVKEWFKGTSFFAISRAKAMQHDTPGSRDALSKALARHFWNFDLIKTIDQLNEVCGKGWIDSMCTHWNNVRDKQMVFWHPQPSLMLKPNLMTAGKKYPVLVVLQGGNDCYERLMTRLNTLPDSLGLIMIFPSAVHRISEVTNSWDDDTVAAYPKLDIIISELMADPTVDKENINLIGFSQGSQIAYGYGLSRPEKIKNIIAFAGFAPSAVNEGQLSVAAQRGMRIFAISGTSDAKEFLSSTRNLQKQAEAKKLRFDMRVEPDLPHGLPINAVGFIAKLWRDIASPAPGGGSDH
ncbi:MAG: hypothetical protein ABI778_00200 [Ignavibacteriota bacterium]